MIMRTSLLTAALALLVASGVAGCNGDPADGEPPETVDGMELVVYEDDRLSFVHPEGWDVEVAEGTTEQRVRVERREPGAEHAEAVIEAAWPFVAGALEADLERTVHMYGRDPDEPEVSDFEQRPVEVPGAEEALLQSYHHTDAVIGEEIPFRTWSVFAVAEVGRPMYLLVGVLEGSEIDADALAEAVIASLELKEEWG